MSKFEKGKSGNPAGRPKGKQSETKRAIIEALEGFTADNMEKLFAEIKALKGKDYIAAMKDILPYVLPKLKSVEMQAEVITNEFDGMTEEELELEIKRYMNA